MPMLTILQLIILSTSAVYGFVPHGDIGTLAAAKAAMFPLQQQNARPNDIAVYDPGVDKLKLDSATYIDNLPMNAMDADFVGDESAYDTSNVDVNRLVDNLRDDIRADENIARKSAILLKLLQDSPGKTPLPILYVEEDIDEPLDDLDSYMMSKRSGRYYRRYPWKRQNSRSRTKYEAESRYLCVPSRDDVFKLLVSLHENRNGNMQRVVHFCNRKRPAKAIFTNIRFIG